MAQPNSFVAREFDAAAWFLRQPSTEGQPTATPDNDVKLRMYALFKQANSGDIATAEPSRFAIEKRMKWMAWKNCKGMNKGDAKAECVLAPC